jgi:3-phosphoshikimate 1-carboxyvinyltransferase
MNAIIGNGINGGAVNAPPSKSYTIRALFAAALAAGESRVGNPLFADDTAAAVEVLSQLGAGIVQESDCWTVTGGNLTPPHQVLNCRQSAATLRFLAPVCAALKGTSRITFAPGLARRPLAPLLDAFQQMGVASKLADSCFTISGRDGRFETDIVRLPGNISSQFVSGLLLAGPTAIDGLTVLMTTPAESKDYLRMTVSSLKAFGIDVAHDAGLTEFRVAHQPYRPAAYVIEGDWSSASYFLGLGAIGARVTVGGLNPDSFQADRFMLHCLRRMNAALTINGNDIAVAPSSLTAIEVDLNEAIDLLPTVACLAAVARGQSVITGLGRARLKESDRVAAVADNLKRMGIGVVEAPERLTITGGQPQGAVIDSFDDHRIAMAFAMLGGTCGGTTILGAECVNKTYPGFWADFRRAGGKVILSE